MCRRRDVDYHYSQSSLWESFRTLYLHGQICDSDCRGSKLAPYIQLCMFFEERDFVLLGHGVPVPSIECVRNAGSFY